MIAIPRHIRAGSVLFLGLVTILQIGCVASRGDKMIGGPCDVPPGQNAMRAEQSAMRGSQLISGELVRMDGPTYILKEESGKEVRVHTDETTEKSPINQGDYISANVDTQNHALWIRANRGTDRRTEHASADCSPS